MTSVGLRKLWSQLSKYVQLARSGETVHITDRGVVVAELGPPPTVSSSGLPVTTLDELRRKGLVYGAADNDASLYPAMPRALKSRRGSDLLDQERFGR